MAADAGIFAQYQNPIRSMADYRGDMDKQEQNALTLAAGRMSAQTSQQALADDQATRQAWASSGGDPAKAVNALQALGLSKQALAAQKGILENQESQAKITHFGAQSAESNQKVADARQAAIGQTLGSLSKIEGGATAQHVTNAMQHLVDIGQISPEMAQKITAGAPADPSQMQGWLLQGQRAVLGVKDQAPKFQTIDTGGAVNTGTVDPVTGAFSPAKSMPKTQTEESKAVERSTRRGQDMTAGTAGARLAFDKSQAAAENAPDNTTEEEKKLWLHTYTANNGQMPRSAPPAVRKSIGTWAAEMGITPNDLSSGAAKAKFDAAMAVTAGHRGGAMASVEATMPALVANAQEASHQLGQGKFVPLNQLMQMTDEKISDPALAKFKVAHMAVVSEYQQVISRGGTNVTALNEAMHVLNGARGVEAYDAAMNMVKKEVAINVAGTKAVRASMGTADHGVSELPGASKPAAAPDIHAQADAILGRK